MEININTAPEREQYLRLLLEILLVLAQNPPSAQNSRAIQNIQQLFYAVNNN